MINKYNNPIQKKKRRTLSLLGLQFIRMDQCENIKSSVWKKHTFKNEKWKMEKRRRNKFRIWNNIRTIETEIQRVSAIGRLP